MTELEVERGEGLHLGDPKSQHPLSSPLQLLEISFNCLEDVESTIPVSPLHLAVSPSSSLAFLTPTLFSGLHKGTSHCDLSLIAAILRGWAWCRGETWRASEG